MLVFAHPETAVLSLASSFSVVVAVAAAVAARAATTVNSATALTAYTVSQSPAYTSSNAYDFTHTIAAARWSVSCKYTVTALRADAFNLLLLLGVSVTAVRRTIKNSLKHSLHWY
jgi:hypothetical protein